MSRLRWNWGCFVSREGLYRVDPQHEMDLCFRVQRRTCAAVRGSYDVLIKEQPARGSPQIAT